MGGVALMVAVLAFMALGFFAMGQLDGFLSRNQIAMEQEPCGQKCALCIAFSNPLQKSCPCPVEVSSGKCYDGRILRQSRISGNTVCRKRRGGVK